jgi:hypothetical protein
MRVCGGEGVGPRIWVCERAYVCAFVGTRARACARARVAVFIQYATRRRHIICGLSHSTSFLDIIS